MARGTCAHLWGKHSLGSTLLTVLLSLYDWVVSYYRHDRAVDDFTTALRLLSASATTQTSAENSPAKDMRGNAGSLRCPSKTPEKTIGRGSSYKDESGVDDDQKEYGTHGISEKKQGQAFPPAEEGGGASISPGHGKHGSRVGQTMTDIPPAQVEEDLGDGDVVADESMGRGAARRVSTGGRDGGDGMDEGGSLVGACHYAR